MISFENTKVAFKSKSSPDLRRAYWLFKMVSSNNMVKFGKWATNIALKLRLPIDGVIRKTIFKQFCGGISIKDSLATSDDLAKHNVLTILDYSIEGKTQEEDFDATVKEIISTIKEAEKNKNIPFAVFKVTGICPFSLLEASNNGTGTLTSDQKLAHEKLIQRVDSICAYAHKANVPIFIDAEESWIQDGIDSISREMSLKYNKNKAIVFNTLQLYRHDRLEFLKTEIEFSRTNNIKLGVKIVRGAYMEKERSRASEKGYLSPIQRDKDATDKDFNKALSVVINNIDIVSVCAGSHNEESALILTKLMADKGLPPNDDRIFYAQLLGMSDHISYNLSDQNYNVAKYVPYGPVREVLPYLIRRAEENTSVAGQTTRELSLIMKERKRRKKV
ncbi:MAG: proline dehydrogenase family protein [Flavobacteriales bacterium]|nr:proline dehydrogenase family protein [Flavobacteriales bacterium]